MEIHTYLKRNNNPLRLSPLIDSGSTEKEQLAINDPATGVWQNNLRALPEERVGLACGTVEG